MENAQRCREWADIGIGEGTCLAFITSINLTLDLCQLLYSFPIYFLIESPFFQPCLEDITLSRLSKPYHFGSVQLISLCIYYSCARHISLSIWPAANAIYRASSHLHSRALLVNILFGVIFSMSAVSPDHFHLRYSLRYRKKKKRKKEGSNELIHLS